MKLGASLCAAAASSPGAAATTAPDPADEDSVEESRIAPGVAAGTAVNAVGGNCNPGATGGALPSADTFAGPAALSFPLAAGAAACAVMAVNVVAGDCRSSTVRSSPSPAALGSCGGNGALVVVEACVSPKPGTASPSARLSESTDAPSAASDACAARN